MKNSFKFIFFLLILFLSRTVFAQTSFTVQGDGNKFYPVTFFDGGWNANAAVELEIGRSVVHKEPSDWWGSIIATFRYHVNGYGSGANFIDADIKQKNANPNTTLVMVGGWRDLTGANSSSRIAIWLRGNTTYYYKANYSVNPAVYDGVTNPLPYQEENGPSLTFKTVADAYVNSQGMTYSNTAYFNGGGTSYFAGTVGIGTTNPVGYKLAVKGTIGAMRVKVTQNDWADFVFEPEYKLPSLADLETYIKTNKHLPEVPSAAEVAKGGLDLGEMNKILLQKIEELTLHLIELHKEISRIKEMQK